MTETARKLASAALELGPDERLALASQLIRSVEGDYEGWEQVWSSELDTRVQRADQREVRGRDWSELRAEFLLDDASR